MMSLRFSKMFLQLRTRLSRAHLHSIVQSDRGLLRVRGDESFSFLQGLITNDMQHLKGGAPSMYAMVLNAQGRVQHDVILYNYGSNKYLVETTKSEVERLIRMLKMYKLRKKIEIDDISSSYKCCVLFNKIDNLNEVKNAKLDCSYSIANDNLQEKFGLTKSVDDKIIALDPRLQLLGCKVIIPQAVRLEDLVESSDPCNIESYTELRYRLGVAEGPSELPSGDISALEANADYLHGVSFHKGCYLGQELTARVHHTGVVRKRYMPVVFSKPPPTAIPSETPVVNSKGKSVGRIRAQAGCFGIGLLRIADCLADPDGLSVLGIKITTQKPIWWPIEASKKDIKV